MPMLQQTQLFGPTESTEQLGQACGKRAIARDAPKKVDDKNKWQKTKDKFLCSVAWAYLLSPCLSDKACLLNQLPCQVSFLDLWPQESSWLAEMFFVKLHEQHCDLSCLLLPKLNQRQQHTVPAFSPTRHTCMTCSHKALHHIIHRSYFTPAPHLSGHGGTNPLFAPHTRTTSTRIWRTCPSGTNPMTSPIKTNWHSTSKGLFIWPSVIVRTT